MAGAQGALAPSPAPRVGGWAPSEALTCLSFPFTGAAGSDDSAAAGPHAGSQRRHMWSVLQRSGGGWEAGKIVAAKRKEEKVSFSRGEGITD